MIRKMTLAALALLMTFLLSGCAGAGYASGGVGVRGAHSFNSTIHGHVAHGGAGVPGVRVAVAGYRYFSITDGRGYYRIYFHSSAPAGVHRMGVRLNISKPGYRNRSVGITLRDGLSTSAQIGLHR